MSKQKKKGLVPVLRFPEFHSERNWEFEKLGTIFAERQDKGFDHLPLLSLTDKDGIIPQEETNRKNNSSSDKSKYLRVCPGDVAYNTMRMWEGRSAYVNIEGLVSPAYTVCKPRNETNGLLFSYYFKTQQLIREFHRYSQGLVKDTLNLKYEAFSRIEAPVPFPEEQKKIADCLTSVDELITAQTKKLDALKTHKKGLMQQLFPAEGETAPKLRFPEFLDKGEWKEKFIRDLGEIITGSTPSTTKPEYYGGDRLFVSPADISDQRFIEKTKTTLTELGFSETRPVKPGSILFVCIGSTIGKIAQNHHECATNQQINAVVPSANYANAFVYYSLENNSEKISGLAGNHAVPIINKTAFGAVEIRFPKLPEQQKIADFLSSIDELITAKIQKVNALKAHKKGLMQQLFPAIDEVDK